MKQLILLALALLLSPVTAQAYLIYYDTSFTVSAENMQPATYGWTYGEVSGAVHFAQDTDSGEISERRFGVAQGPNVSPSIYGIAYLVVVSPTDVLFAISDPGGSINLHLLYDTPLDPWPLASALPEPDWLAASFGYELGAPLGSSCGAWPIPPCPIGGSGAQTFARGEFDFAVSGIDAPQAIALTAAQVPEPSSLALLAMGLIGAAAFARSRDQVGINPSKVQ